MSTIAAALGRILIALLFIVSGVMKFADPGPSSEMLRAASLSPALTFPVAIFEVLLGIALAIGAMTRIAAILLALFTAATILFFHHDFADPAQLPVILLHVALVGGLLGVFAHSQMWWSYDALRRRRAEDLADRDRAADRRVHDAEERAARAEAHAEGRHAEAEDLRPRRRWF
jgi:putative oxidoreductase